MKRINITINPADNGYTITGQASDANGMNQIPINKIAKDDKEVQGHVMEFLKVTFAMIGTEPKP